MEDAAVFRPGRVKITIVAASAALVAAGGIAIVVLPHGHARTASSSASQQSHALRVVSVTPAPGTQDVNGTAPIRLTLAYDVTAAGSSLPVVSPAIAGSWRQAGTTLTFTPSTGFAPRTHVTITVPRQAWSASYTTGTYSLLRLQQLLAQLGYLPMTWSALSAGAGTSDTANDTANDTGNDTASHTHTGITSATPAPSKAASASPASASPASSSPASSSTVSSTTAANATTASAASSADGGMPGTAGPSSAAYQLSAAYQPPAGTFDWQYGYPWSLRNFWQPGQMNLVTTGAIMAFESDHGMQMDGQATPAVWTALLRAAAARQLNPNGYTYAVASQYQPESLTIWHDGREVFHSYANTGIPVSPTAVGTFPVYLRYRFQIMQGTNPDGSRYADPVQFVSYFHGGEAVHYFPRYSYGWPQSLGCVELPLGPAAQAWPYLTYGSLVTVTPE
jgi:hypothetical protein